jgi:hypothetical protein
VLRHGCTGRANDTPNFGRIFSAKPARETQFGAKFSF